MNVFVFQVKQRDGSPFPHLFEKSKNSSCMTLLSSPKVSMWKFYLPSELDCRLTRSHYKQSSEKPFTSSNFKTIFGIFCSQFSCFLFTS